MKKMTRTQVIVALGSTIATGLTASSVQASEANPFKLSEIKGYMQTAEKMKEGACGEGQCGAAMMKGSEEKTAEGNCAGNKTMPKSEEGKCGEGKCGEGKCGGKKEEK